MQYPTVYYFKLLHIFLINILTAVTIVFLRPGTIEWLQFLSWRNWMILLDVPMHGSPLQRSSLNAGKNES